MKHIVELKITGMAHDGRGIGFLPQPGQSRGLAVFVEGALPEQTVACQIIRQNANFWHAKLNEVLSCDFAPIPPHCPQQDLCGGCPLQPLPYERQLFWKEQLALNALSRIGKLDKDELAAAWTGLAPSPLLQGFRNKITLAFGKTATGAPALGLRAPGSHAVAPMSSCALLPAGAEAVVQQAFALASASGSPFYDKDGGFWRFLILRHGGIIDQNGDWAGMGWHALLLTSGGNRAQRKQVEKLGHELLREQPGLRTFIHEERSRKDMLHFGERRLLCLSQNSQKPHDGMALELGGRQFGLDWTSFFQVNSGAGEILAVKTQEMDSAGQDKLLDLFCGVGAPGILLADKHVGCLGIEQDAAACRWAERNTADFSSFHYECGDVSARLRELVKTGRRCEFHTILLDPPRSGLGEAGMRHVLALAPRQIIHISCNPATLARDAGVLRQDYRLEKLAGVDMFPHTPHLECCGLWRKRE